MIRAILIIAIVAIFAWFLNQRTTTRGQAWGKLGAIFLLLFGLSAIVSPRIIDDLAHKVGVGRGADLLLYGLTIAFLASLLTSYMHRQDDHVKIINLARKIALLEASKDERNKNILGRSKKS